jgi:RimJ/RimL family protein N-acetyltransferase
LEHLLTVYPELTHVGFTTWSGNLGMMRLGERSGMQLEGRIRKVRYWQGKYYDSIKYGLLRTEI